MEEVVHKCRKFLAKELAEFCGQTAVGLELWNSGKLFSLLCPAVTLKGDIAI